MHRLFAFLHLLPLAITVSAQENAVGTSTITFGVGGGFSLYNPYGSGGPVFNGSYEYRIWKYLAVEAGVHNTLVTVPTYGYLYSPTIIGPGLGTTSFTYPTTLFTTGSARNTTVPFGFKGILPLNSATSGWEPLVNSCRSLDTLPSTGPPGPPISPTASENK